MLILARKKGEIVDITVQNENGKPVKVELQVVEVLKDRVRLGFTAPKEVVVDRREISLLKAAGIPKHIEPVSK